MLPRSKFIYPEVSSYKLYTSRIDQSSSESSQNIICRSTYIIITFSKERIVALVNISISVKREFGIVCSSGRKISSCYIRVCFDRNRISWKEIDEIVSSISLNGSSWRITVCYLFSNNISSTFIVGGIITRTTLIWERFESVSKIWEVIL